MFKTSMNLSCRNLLLFLVIVPIFSGICHAKEEAGGGWGSGPLVKREDRRSVVSTEYGHISEVRIKDVINGGSYLLQFFTLEPNSLFLPVILHADMFFYVHSGCGKLSWTEEDELKRTHIKQGDVYRLEQGSVFFVNSSKETDQAEPQKLRIHAIFANSDEDLREPATGPYSSIRDMIHGFDKRVLQATFQVSDEVIEELFSGTKPPAIVPADEQSESESEKTSWEIEDRYITSLLSGRSYNIFESNKKKRRKESAKLFNLLEKEKDFENCNGWSTTVTKKKLSALKGSNFGLFMVNLTEGSMMSPHWNPMATEIAIALHGQGMIRVVCSSLYDDTTECQKMRFKVDEGDVFSVPRFHSMAQMAFNNNTFVFVGFSTSTRKNHPQFLAGKASFLRVLDKDVLAASFNSTKETINQFVASEDDSVILKCTSCAEEEFWKMEEESEEDEERRKREDDEERQREQKEQEEEREREREREREGGGEGEEPGHGRGGGAPGGETPSDPENHWGKGALRIRLTRG